MIKPNWDIFKAKFNENPHLNFEWFCYLLFCKEFKQDKGIFRYKNQSGIETNPIETDDGEVIGWQAKFYETRLSSHKSKILDTLDTTKRDYPNITKIIFYTNQEWGQTKKGKKSGVLEEIEKRAEELNLKLEWRTASFFESPFVCIENEIIAKHFFTFDKSIFDLIEEQQGHTENILKQIKTTFNFKGQKFGINRNDIIDKLKDTEAQVVILSGVAGVGKTVVIKKYYEQQKEKIPFYIFKATEFNNLRNLNDFFKNFGFKEFIEAHKYDEGRIIVIDSAEKLLDIDNTDPFKEFLQIVLENKWRVIFTTRDNYVNDLNTEFSEIYGILPVNINIQNLTDEELIKLAEKYKFSLPTDQKLFELIRNPFYLNEYLKHYRENKILDYIGFKNKLWNQIIFQSKPIREQCFLQIAFDRANNGDFYITQNCEASILTELSSSGILEYESPRGYFITHDIYEEWALEKIIEREFVNKTSAKDFFTKIGDSLPIRRSFRNWLSEKLLLSDKNIKQFIEDAFNDDIASYWKDEILISVLLSDYSETFFEIFKDRLLENQALLKKLTFLLRLACKEVDSDFFKQLGIKTFNLFSLKCVLTKPKGKGWKSLIKFIFDNIDSIGIENINFILPVIHDWNTKFKNGETTRFASLIALKYYQWIIEKDVYFGHKGGIEKLLQTILYGASEIREELKEIFEEILKNNWKYHSDPYYDLIKMILVPKIENGFAGLDVAKVLPDYILKLADLFWTYTSKKGNSLYPSSSMWAERYFGLEENHFDYFPASAYQTPIYWLLQYSLKETVDFILEFTNKSVKYYAKSGFDSSVKKVKLFFDDGTIQEQYISHYLWNMYRGASSLVSPYLLQSIHMALEKYYLEIAKDIDSETLESWLIYLLKNSESASISAVVASVVLAYPDKTFNVAKILFKTKEFIIQDKHRWVSEMDISCPLGPDLMNEDYQKERIESKNLKHRKVNLEDLFLKYQLFRSEKISGEEAEKRQRELWKILDNYYNQLPDKDKETEEDKIWKLFLARMDRRRMTITTEKADKGIVIHFNPKLEPELKAYSEKLVAKISEPMNYISLKLWARYKMKNDEKYKKYPQYEGNPKHALEEVKKILNEFKTSKSYEFYRSNHSIPGEVCSVLIKYYFGKLLEEEKDFCKNIILGFALLPLGNYKYQISDGVESAISVLPILLKEFPEEKERVKAILLLTLFDPTHIDMNTEFADYPTVAVKELFSISFEDAQSLLFGYLYLKPKYDEFLREKICQENYAKGIYQVKENELTESFVKKYETDLEKVVNNEITYEDLGEIENLDLHILKRAFQLIPEKTDNKLHKEIAKRIINVFVPKIISEDKEDRIDYKIKYDFLQKYAYFVLNSPQDEINDYLKPFIDNFNASKTIADLFQKFILAEYMLNTYDNFWLVWKYFKEKVFKLCEEGEEYRYVDKIIKSYLFATVPWKENAKEWVTLKSKNKTFFREVSQEIGHCPSTLYALTKLLNGIGRLYLNDGIIWISDIIEKNKDLVKKQLETNTVYYIENFARIYIYNNREKIKKTKELKQRILTILDFLIEKGSVVGYMLREDIV